MLRRARKDPNPDTGRGGGEAPCPDGRQCCAIFRRIPFGIVSADAHGRITALNPALLEIVGSPSADETRKLNVLTFPLLVESGVAAIIRRCLQTGGQADVELPYRSYWGKETIVNARVIPFRDGAGAVAGVDLVIEDVKKRREAEEALKAARHFTDRVLMTTPEFLYIFDLDEKRTVFSNRQIAGSLGYSPEEVREIGSRLMEALVHPDDLARVAEHHKRLSSAADGEVFEFESRVRDSSGGWRWLHSRDTVFARDQSGRVTQILGSATDVTAERRMKAELVESEDRFRATFEEAAVGIAHADTAGRVIRANRRFCEIAGIPRDEVLGRSVHDIAHSDDPAADAAYVQGLLDGEIPAFSQERPCVRADGLRTWVNCTMSVVRSPAGDPRYLIVVLEDMSRQKWLEEKFRELSLRDELTGLYNRRGFMTLGEQQCRAAERKKRQMLLVYADLDNLKTLNDTRGHELGDRAIKEAADVLRETFRSEDVIARIGGDEFAVLVTDSSMVAADVFLGHLRRQIEAHNHRSGREFSLGLSSGAVVYDPSETCSIGELLTLADGQMYRDKRKA